MAHAEDLNQHTVCRCFWSSEYPFEHSELTELLCPVARGQTGQSAVLDIPVHTQLVSRGVKDGRLRSCHSKRNESAQLPSNLDQCCAKTATAPGIVSIQWGYCRNIMWLAQITPSCGSKGPSKTYRNTSGFRTISDMRTMMFDAAFKVPASVTVPASPAVDEQALQENCSLPRRQRATAWMCIARSTSTMLPKQLLVQNKEVVPIYRLRRCAESACSTALRTLYIYPKRAHTKFGMARDCSWQFHTVQLT